MFPEALLPVRLVIHMATIKPIVPQTLMGGNIFTRHGTHDVPFGHYESGELR